MHSTAAFLHEPIRAATTLLTIHKSAWLLMFHSIPACRSSCPNILPSLPLTVVLCHSRQPDVTINVGLGLVLEGMGAGFDYGLHGIHGSLICDIGFKLVWLSMFHDISAC